LGSAAAAAVLALAATLQIHSLDDPDVWWHLASGRLIAVRQAVVHVDPFSYTAPGAPWINPQWLFDLALYGAWRGAGPGGVILGSGGLFVAAFAILYALARRHLPAWAAAALLLLAVLAGIERYVPRPEAATYCLLAVFLLILDGDPGPAALAALVGLEVLWANLHALFALGVVVLGLHAAGALAARWLPLPAGFREGAERAGPLATATAAAALAAMLTPFGVDGVLFPLRLLRVIRGGEVTSLAVIEHRPTALGDLAPPAAQALVALLGLALVAQALVLRRRRLHLGRTAVAAAFVALGFFARRNVGLVGLGVMPLLAEGLGGVAEAIDRRRLAAVGIAAVVIVSSLGTGARIVAGRYYDDAHLTRRFGLGVSPVLFPLGAVDFVVAHAAGARIMNDDMLGGLLLWRHPGVPVFIDGRMQVYPSAVFGAYEASLADPSTFPALAARWGVTAVVLYHPAPGRLELARRIARLPGWRLAYLDAGGVVLLADGEPAGDPAGLDDPIPLPAGLAARLGASREAALLHYQRGRAALYLLGARGRAAAARDFAEALRLWPDLSEAAVGLRAAGGRP
jgi:hypothetical protein